RMPCSLPGMTSWSTPPTRAMVREENVGLIVRCYLKRAALRHTAGRTRKSRHPAMWLVTGCLISRYRRQSNVDLLPFAFAGDAADVMDQVTVLGIEEDVGE